MTRRMFGTILAPMIGLQRRDILAERAEHQPGENLDAQLPRRVLLGWLSGGMPPLPPMPRRNATPVRLPHRS